MNGLFYTTVQFCSLYNSLSIAEGPHIEMDDAVRFLEVVTVVKMMPP